MTDLRVGKTPLVALHGANPEQGRWFAKLEGENDTGSMKLRSAYKILIEAQLAPGTTVIESTSGNMGVALAAVARELDLKAVLITDPKLSHERRRAMERLGARVIRVEKLDKTGGWLLTRLAQVHALLERHSDWFWVNQYSNPLNPLAFESIAIELMRDLEGVQVWDDTTLWYFASVSTGGSLSGSARALRRLHYSGAPPLSKLRIVAVDAEGSAIFGRPPRTRHLNGIGSSLANPPNLQRSLITDVVIVTDAQAFQACHLLREEGTFSVGVGGSSGAVWAALVQRAAWFSPHDIVIALFPDAGYIYERTIYSPMWLRAHGFMQLAQNVQGGRSNAVG